MLHPPDRSRWLLSQLSQLSLLSPLLLVPALAGQGTHAPAPQESLPAPLSLSRTAGLHILDGTLQGVGDGYRVRFDPAGFEFTPALGDAAPRDYPMSFELESIGRGPDRVVARSASPQGPSWRDLRVEYDRGIAIERYDIGVDAIEQSFVFHRRPAGTGDLIVRGRLATDLLVTPHGAGLRLEQPGLGGFHIGGVFGIDGDGKRAEGRVRFEAGILELSLPAAFVDAAALPLTLDPLLGQVFRFTSSAVDDRARVSFDVTTDSYLVVWQSSIAIHGQRVSRAGALLGTRVVIDTSARLAEVANVNDRNAFVVVYERNGDILGRTVSAVSGSVSLASIIAGGTAIQTKPTVGGSRPSALVARGRALCAWESGNRTLEAARLVVNSDLTISVGTVQTVATAGPRPPDSPRLSKSDASNRYALVFHRDDTVTSLDRVVATVLDTTGKAITPELFVDPGLVDQFGCEVDGDGTNWVVAWATRDSNGFQSIRARGIEFSPSRSVLQQLSNSAFAPFQAGTTALPSVTWTGDSVLVGYTVFGFGLPTPRPRVESVTPITCFRCEGLFDFPIGPNPATPFGCGTVASGGPVDDAMFVTNDDTGIFAQLFRAKDGSATSRGGGCGRGGTAFHPCARASCVSSHLTWLRDSIPGSPTILVISAGENVFPCGQCSLIPDLGTAITIPMTTSATGDANVDLPGCLSNLVGVPLFEQWVTLNVSSPACAQFNIDFSNALRVVFD